MMTALWIFTTFVGLCMSAFGALYLMYGTGWNDGAAWRAAQKRERARMIILPVAVVLAVGTEPLAAATPGPEVALPPAILPPG